MGRTPRNDLMPKVSCKESLKARVLAFFVIIGFSIILLSAVTVTCMLQ